MKNILSILFGWLFGKSEADSNEMDYNPGPSAEESDDSNPLFV